MLTKASVDWISVTSLNGSSVRHPRLQNIYEDRERGLNGYTNSIKFIDGRIEGVHPGREEMGTHIVYSGDTLTHCQDQGCSPIELLSWHIKEGHRISRIDPYIDAIEFALDIGKLTERVENKEVQTFCKSVLHIEEKQGAGETLWFGKGRPKSMRIYDKAAEQKVSGDWKRIEVQFRREHARQAGSVITSSKTPEKSIQSVIKGFVDFPTDAIYQAIVGDNLVRTDNERKADTNTREWLLNIVATSISNLIVSGDINIMDDLKESVSLKLSEKMKRLNIKKTDSD